MASKDCFRYFYEIDLDTDTTASKILHLVGQGKRVLECGCGPGHMTRVLVDHFRCEVTGIEIDKDAAKEAETFCHRVICGDLDILNLEECLEGQKFDVVVFADVLEHLKDPGRSLKQAHKILAPDSYVVISVPNIAYAGLLADLLQGRFRYREKGLLDATHLRFFTAEGLRELLTKEGYFIATWDRMQVAPEDTEFGACLEELPPVIREFLLDGPEAMTYQFVIKVCPSDSTKTVKDLKDGLRLAEEERLFLRNQGHNSELDTLRTRLAQTEAELTLTRSSKIWRLAAPLRALRRLWSGICVL
ncbi:MAG: class I SAM-dependent methyltransferase [Proteobacteria bacterium]|nr:class I SAM-dependent methyltransferase [Pseudomonadota bacterium]